MASAGRSLRLLALPAGIRYPGCPTENPATRCFANAAKVKPKVVLVGWLGAQRKHLAKYEDLWQKLGHSTLCLQPRTSSVVLPPLCDRQAAAFLTEVQQFQGAASFRPTIYHVFSNAGAIFMGTVLRNLTLREPSTTHLLSGPDAEPGQQVSARELGDVVGFVMDSSPARLTPDIAARGFVAAALGRPAVNIQRERPRLVGTVHHLLKPFLDSRYISSRQAQVWRAWQLAPKCPQLYLYSSCDALIPPDEVERFMGLQKLRGVHVRHKQWHDSPHCEHLRWHPAEYTEQLQLFLETVHT